MQQNSFSKEDYNCPMVKTMGMMKSIVKFHEGCLRVIEATSRQEKKISMGYIEAKLADTVIYKLTRMKFIMPTLPPAKIAKEFDDLHELIDKSFNELQYQK